MSVQGGFGQSQVRASARGWVVQQFSIQPRIAFTVELTHTLPPGQNYNLIVSEVAGSLSIRGKDGNVYNAGTLATLPSFTVMSSGGVWAPQVFAELDYYTLRKIEQLRGGGDVDFSLDLYLDVEVQNQPQNKGQVVLPGISGHISKSDWVEKLLPAMQFKNVSLVEMPQIRQTGFDDVAANLDSAWKEYASGKYDDVLGDCRKTLEALKLSLKKLGAVTKNAGEEQIDWGKLTGNDETGNILSAIFQKLWGFTAPGAHIGKAINREDGDFALLVTHAIVSLAVEKSRTK